MKKNNNLINNELKVSATTWNDNSELADGSHSVSDILN